MTTALEIGLVAFLLSLGLTPAVRALALRLGAVARPRQDRWHRREIALLGGVAIATATLGVVAALVDVDPPLSAMLIGAGLMGAVGLYDDLRPLRPASKLVLQIAVALAVAVAGPRVTPIDLPGLDVLITAFWLVAMTNAINLLDNMDGLAAGVALVALGFAIVLGWGDHYTARLGVMGALTGAVAGFLVFNFNPAAIFMGDSGSLFIGMLLAALALPTGQGDAPSALAAFAVPAVLLAVPLIDTAMVSVVRVLSRRRVADGGRDHTSHRLVAIGLSERGAVLFLYGLAAASGITALAVQRSDPAMATALVIAFVVGTGLFAVYIAQVRVYDHEQFSALRGHRLTPLLAELTFKRRLFEVVLDVLLIWVSYTAAFGLRFEGEAPPGFGESFVQSVPLVLGAKLLGLWMSGIYSGVWRFVSITDLIGYLKGTTAGSVLAVLGVTYFYRFEGFSRGVFVVDALVLFLLLVGSRLSFRLLAEFLGTYRNTGTPVLIYGAGKGGALLLRELASNAELGLRVVGMIDDDPHKRGQRMFGVLVMGAGSDLDTLLTRTGAEQVIVSTRTLTPERVALLDAACAERQVRVRQMSFVIT